MIPGTSPALDSSISFVCTDTWPGIPSISITVSGSPPAANVSSVKMEFRTNAESSDTLLELTSAAGDILITSAANWTFSVPAQDLDLPAGTYTWGFRTTDVNGVKQTYLAGTQLVTPPAVY